MRAALIALLLMPGAICAGTADAIRASEELMLSGAPCTTRTDIDELGDGDPVKCLLYQEAELHLRPIRWHKEITTF